MITALHYDYGDYGRLTKMTETIIGDQSFVTQYEYNEYGDKTGITYPGGFKVKRNYNTNLLYIDYLNNGNIERKTDAGAWKYEYDNFFPVHGVKKINLPTPELENAGYQEIEYNSFNKASVIKNNQSQRLVIDYGVDQQRTRTRFYKGHIFLEKTKYFAAGYEKETGGGIIRFF